MWWALLGAGTLKHDCPVLSCPVENPTVNKADVGFFTILLRVSILAVVEQASQQYLNTLVVKCYGGENEAVWKHMSKLLMYFWKKGEWSSGKHH